MLALRPYQAEAHRQILAAWAECDSVCLELATGLGKTEVAMAVAATRREQAGPVLFLAHRDELIEQPRARLAAKTHLVVGVEKADLRASRLMPEDIVLATPQTMRGSRLASWPSDAFATIIVDEAHHAASDSYVAVLEHFGDAKVLGLSATPFRMDGKPLIGEIFERRICTIELPEAIEEGWLVPLRGREVRVDGLDLEAVRKVRGDLSAQDLEAMIAEERPAQQIADPIIHEILDAGHLGIVFTPSVRTAEMLAGVLQRDVEGRYVDAAVASAETPPDRRREIVAGFRAGKIRALVNCMLFTEGFDAPEASLCAMARPTLSTILYRQCIGRVTRPLPGILDGLETAAERRAAIAASAKPWAVVIDFVGNSSRHELVGLPEAMGAVDPDVRRRAREKLAAGAEALDAIRHADAEVLAERAAKREAAQEAAQEAQRRREDARRRYEASRRGVRASAWWTEADFDLMAAGGALEGARPEYPTEKSEHTLRVMRFLGAAVPARVRPWHRKLCTERQQAALDRLGLGEHSAELSVADASAVLDALAKRRERGMATPKQLRAMRRAGAQVSARTTFDEAHAWLDRRYGRART